MKKSIKLVKNRSDIGAGTRGADLGIDAIEIAAINKGSEYFNTFPFIDVETHNETIYNKDRSTFAKRIEHVLQQCRRVAGAVNRTMSEKYFPLVLSGDHSSALGTISGIKTAFPDKTLGVVWIDAHADLHSPYTSPSGNIHGMPLAAALANDNLNCQVNPIQGEIRHFWNDLKKIGTPDAKLTPEHLIYFGVRDTEEAEDRLIESLGIKNYRVEEIRFRGLVKCVDEALHKLTVCDMIYISFDVDSMDCDLISLGTGTPVSKGFDQYEVMAIMKQLIGSQKVVCVELVEVNPLLDNKGNKMAETAFEVLEQTSIAIDLQP
ncbi:arginase [Mucilaginibacter sp. KACC 22773]|uniref:arginase n=1 Tax=Mucilaginibacter sp. KACC 22773 TaxID=3025671 RepID=UPI002366BD7A|nr:arginase [Mucilaginibacter sp. KACC 22773]WDF77199.1 arginase [Mucilaginibacter sp. KACC 22773]